MEILKKPENIREPKIEQVVSIIESIDNVHFQYIQKFIESSNNENNYYVDELLTEEYKAEQELFKSKEKQENESNPIENKKEELFPISNRKGSRNKENRYSLNILKSADKLNEENESTHKRSFSEEQNGQEQSLIDIVKAITNSMYNSRNLIYVRNDGSNWSDLAKPENPDTLEKNINSNDDIDNLSEYEDMFDFGATSDLNLSGKEKDKKNGTQRVRSKSTSHKNDSEEVINKKEGKNNNFRISRTTDYLNYYNINDLEDKVESEESRKELKNAFDDIINSENHFSISSSNKNSKSSGIGKAASLRRKLSNFHFVNSSSNN